MKRLIRKAEYEYMNVIQKAIKMPGVKEHILDAAKDFAEEQFEWDIENPISASECLEKFHLSLSENPDYTVEYLDSTILDAFESDDYDTNVEIMNTKDFEIRFVEELFDAYVSEIEDVIDEVEEEVNERFGR